MLKSRIKEIRDNVLYYVEGEELDKVLAELGVETEEEAEIKLAELEKAETFRVEHHRIECTANKHTKENIDYILECANAGDTLVRMVEFETETEARAYIETQKAKLPPVREYSYTVKTLVMEWLRLGMLNEDWENGAEWEEDITPVNE